MAFSLEASLCGWDPSAETSSWAFGWAALSGRSGSCTCWTIRARLGIAFLITPFNNSPLECAAAVSFKFFDLIAPVDNIKAIVP